MSGNCLPAASVVYVFSGGDSLITKENLSVSVQKCSTQERWMVVSKIICHSSYKINCSFPFISPPLKLIAECKVKTERETELISEQVLIAMAEMGLDRERTLQV